MIDPRTLSFATIRGFSVVQDYSRASRYSVAMAGDAWQQALAIRPDEACGSSDPDCRIIFRELPPGTALITSAL